MEMNNKYLASEEHADIFEGIHSSSPYEDVIAAIDVLVQNHAAILACNGFLLPPVGVVGGIIACRKQKVRTTKDVTNKDLVIIQSDVDWKKYVKGVGETMREKPKSQRTRGTKARKKGAIKSYTMHLSVKLVKDTTPKRQRSSSIGNSNLGSKRIAMEGKELAAKALLISICEPMETKDGQKKPRGTEKKNFLYEKFASFIIRDRVRTTILHDVRIAQCYYYTASVTFPLTNSASVPFSHRMTVIQIRSQVRI